MEVAVPRIRHRPRRPDQQLDFFVASQQPTPCPVSGWNALPDQARQEVTVLMIRLLVAHAGGVVVQRERGDDER